MVSLYRCLTCANFKEGEGLIAADEMEEERRRRSNKKLEIQDLLQDVNNKIITVEKANSRLISEVRLKISTNSQGMDTTMTA